MPLVVLSKVYTTYLSTFGDDYMYQQQKPLPLSELYSPKSNEGLISLLKYGLWQVRIPPNFIISLEVQKAFESCGCRLFTRLGGIYL